MSQRVIARLVLVAAVALAVVGAVLGVAVLNKELQSEQKLLVITFSALFASTLVLLFLGTPEEQETPAPQPIRQPPPRPMHVPPPPLPAAAPTPKANDQWWTQTGKPVTAPPPQPETNSVPLEDFDAHRVQIAQCPRCAGFELDVRREGRGYAFECHNPHCRNRWEWLPGTAWPATVVRHNLITAASAEGERR
ncbi:hypothetical protein [Lentzea aerocolonigenes]|uniref:hypothetical protein n=1 Tax=Lentzea aerocolonigenes TaxID=68170 RepID=UPI0004C2DA38|nr:hypothetical protein [Lentzea aerocolonigenes]MCP2242625.1 hypothetical protein [Lentzea aerocolonigenes]